MSLLERKLSEIGLSESQIKQVVDVINEICPRCRNESIKDYPTCESCKWEDYDSPGCYSE